MPRRTSTSVSAGTQSSTATTIPQISPSLVNLNYVGTNNSSSCLDISTKIYTKHSTRNNPHIGDTLSITDPLIDSVTNTNSSDCNTPLLVSHENEKVPYRQHSNSPHNYRSLSTVTSSDLLNFYRSTLPHTNRYVTPAADDWRMYTVVCLIAIACYISGIPGDFVHDDIPAITLNKDVLGTSSISHVFKNDFWGTQMADINSHKSYRPLTVLSFRLNRFLFGMQPMWFHIINVLLHAAVCVLFTRVCIAVAGLRRNFAMLAGILFAVHPIHTEAVTGIVGRADVLACIFFLISLLVYHGQSNNSSQSNLTLWLSIAMGGLSMLAKETGIMVFLLNLIYDLYRCWPSLKRSIIERRMTDDSQLYCRRTSKVFISMTVLLVIRLAMLQGSLPKFSQQDNPTAFHPNLLVRILTFCYLAAFNWWLLLCPSTISHDWQMGSIPLLTSISDPRNLMTCAAVIVTMLLAYRGVMDFEHQRHMPLILGLLMLVLPFLPATNLFVTVGFVVAERVLYIPSLGCVLLVVYGITLVWEATPKYRGLITLMGILLITAGTCKTISRNGEWYSRESLLRAGLAVLPHNAKMHYNFGNFLRDSSQPDIAIKHYTEALRLWPSYASAYNNLGTLLKEPDLAEKHFLAAIRYSGDHVNAHYNLGQLYRKNNRTAEASKMLERCILLEPTFAAPYLELLKIRTGIPASKLLGQYVKMDPSDPERVTQYGFWLLNHNYPLGALQQFENALNVSEKHQMAFIGTCRTLRKLGYRSRLHQIISRWQLMVRIANGGMPKQAEIYLRDWSIKNELRNRAMSYDVELTSYYEPTSLPSTPVKLIDSPHPYTTKTTTIRVYTMSEQNCNISDNVQPYPSEPPTPQPAPPGVEYGERKQRSKTCRKKRWSVGCASDYRPQQINEIPPIFVSNILGKL